MRLARLPNALVVALVLVCLLFPVLVVLLISFSSATYLRFPPPGFSLRWYTKLVGSDRRRE